MGLGHASSTTDRGEQSTALEVPELHPLPTPHVPLEARSLRGCHGLDVVTGICSSWPFQVAFCLVVCTQASSMSSCGPRTHFSMALNEVPGAALGDAHPAFRIALPSGVTCAGLAQPLRPKSSASVTRSLLCDAPSAWIVVGLSLGLVSQAQADLHRQTARAEAAVGDGFRCRLEVGSEGEAFLGPG